MGGTQALDPRERAAEITRIRAKIDNFPHYNFYKCHRPDLKIACILDTFSYECFKYEAALQQLRLETWRQQIQAMKPHFLLVESAWRGVDDTWRNVLTDKHKGSKKELLDLLSFCKENSIPTVFWNKEDPANYPHFIETAKLFDFIFTTDENSIEQYRQDTGHDRSYVLPFAAQPAIHNPINSSYIDKENVAFAGTWYAAKHIERQADLQLLLNPAKAFGLHIFDRMHNFTGNMNYKFPEPYQSQIVGELNYADMIKAYKLYKVFLNANSVKDSPTMFSRRVFELLASGTNVLSTYSQGIEKMFGGIVAFASSEDEASMQLQHMLSIPEHSQRLSLLGIRAIHAQHLYKHRLNTILATIGFGSFPEDVTGVSVIAYAPPKSMLPLIDQFLAQTWPVKELIMVLKEGKLTPSVNAKAVKAYPNVSIIPAPKGISLGHCLNTAVKKTKYEYISVFMEDDYYGPNFLTDLMNAFNYTDADMVGKGCYYSYNKKAKTLTLENPDREYKFISFMSCPAMIIKKSVLTEIALVETDRCFEPFLVQCSNQGFKIFSSDKYNYIYANHHSETAPAADSAQSKYYVNCQANAVRQLRV